MMEWFEGLVIEIHEAYEEWNKVDERISKEYPRAWGLVEGTQIVRTSITIGSVIVVLYLAIFGGCTL